MTAGDDAGSADGAAGGAGEASAAPDADPPHEDASSSDGSSGGGAPNDGAAPDEGAPPAADGMATPDGAACDTIVEPRAIEGRDHLPALCAPTSYLSNPPSSGNHYAAWAAFKTYDFPLPAGFFVHDLEHGAVVITYNCPDGCAEDVAAIQAFIDALPQDPVCIGSSAARRIVLTPYPALTVRFAASAWGFTLRSSCFDKTAFGDFVSAHYGHAPENYCYDGIEVTSTTCP